MFSYTSLRILNLVYNKTDIPLQLEEYKSYGTRRSASCHISLHILLGVLEYLLSTVYTSCITSSLTDLVYHTQYRIDDTNTCSYRTEPT